MRSWLCAMEGRILGLLSFICSTEGSGLSVPPLITKKITLYVNGI